MSAPHHVIASDAHNGLYSAERAIYLETGVGDRFDCGSGTLVSTGPMTWEVRDAAGQAVATIGVASTVRRRYTLAEQRANNARSRAADPEMDAYLTEWFNESVDG